MRKLFIISVISLISTPLIKAQGKPHFYLQGEIGPSIERLIDGFSISSSHDGISFYDYGRMNLAFSSDIETGFKNNSWMMGIGSQLLYPAILMPYIKLGCNYFRNKDFFLGNYVAVTFFKYKHVKTGFYFSRKSLVISLNLNKYLGIDYLSTLLDTYIYEDYSLNLEIGYIFSQPKKKIKI